MGPEIFIFKDIDMLTNILCITTNNSNKKKINDDVIKINEKCVWLHYQHFAVVFSEVLWHSGEQSLSKIYIWILYCKMENSVWEHYSSTVTLGNNIYSIQLEGKNLTMTVCTCDDKPLYVTGGVGARSHSETYKNIYPLIESERVHQPR